jgi:hypothetical protein
MGPMTRPMPGNLLAEHARAYAQRGWYVLPLWWPASGRCACGMYGCQSSAKHPIWHLVPQGLHDAVVDLDQIAAWWSSFPRANVGVRTGGESGLVVLDLDGEIGERMLAGLVALHGRLNALWARTGSGGWHAYMAHPGVRVPTSVRRMGDGLDMRGDGGYVVAPPSWHASIHRYRWVDSPAEKIALGGRELPPMPAWLLELAAPDERERSASPPVRLQPHDASSYVTTAVEREAIGIAQAPPGQRNDTLNRAAFSLGQLIGAGLLDEETVTEVLVAAALSAGPDERKIRATVRRGLRAGMARPREVHIGAPRRCAVGTDPGNPPESPDPEPRPC